MSWCSHRNMQSTARRDYCPDCGYEFYYGDAHASGDAQLSKIVNPGRDASANGVQLDDYIPEPYYDDDRSLDLDEDW